MICKATDFYFDSLWKMSIILAIRLGVSFCYDLNLVLDLLDFQVGQKSNNVSQIMKLIFDAKGEKKGCCNPWLAPVVTH